MPHLRRIFADLDDGPVEHEACADAATVLHLSADESERRSELDWLVLWMTPSTPVGSDRMRAPLREVLRIASINGCQTIVVEHHYVCHDWQSEHEAFWVSRHEARAPEAPRLHFFGHRLQADDLYDPPPGTPYLGFSVLRPVPMGPGGRTLLRAPPWLERSVLCTVTEHPSLFGTAYEITGVPFMQQDVELLSCAHAAVWQAHYVAQGRGLAARRWTAQIAELTAGASRPRASEGLTAEQMRASLAALELPTIFWDVEDLPDLPGELPTELHGDWASFVDDDHKPTSGPRLGPDRAIPPGVMREQLLRSLCRSVNSGFPGIVLAEGDGGLHAVNVVGWIRRCDLPVDRRPNSRQDACDEDVVLVVCDDQSGPYELVGDVLTDRRGRWYALILPALERIELSGEAAEERAFAHVKTSARRYAAAQEPHARTDAPLDEADEDLAALAPHIRELRGDISVRVQLVEGRALKAAICAQGRGRDAARVYRLARLPKWVWVAEFHDRALRGTGEPCVMAEVVLDTTSHDSVPITLLSCTLRTAKDAARLRAGESRTTATGTGPGRPWGQLRKITGGLSGLPRADAASNLGQLQTG